MTSQDTYNRMTAAAVEELRRIVGEEYVLCGDAETLEPYSHDEVADPRYAHLPECVVRPDRVQQISAIIKLANRERFPVTPRGAGSGLSGGAVPVMGGVVLLCDRMNRVIEYGQANMMITVEPGMITNEINDLVRDDGLFYAGYPMSLETCCIAGNVAENAGGGKAIKYGVTGRYVTGLEVVTPAGEIVQLGGKRVKDVTGYNLLQLMVGSEGTLGIFANITLRLMPLPKCTADLLVLFETPRAAIDAVPKIMVSGGIIPSAIEFMDQASVRVACEHLNEMIPYERAGALLLISVEGSGVEQVQREYEAIGQLCLEAGGIDVLVADSPTRSERFWMVRRNIAEALKAANPHQSLEDIVVPISAIPDMVAGLEQLSTQYDIQIPCYGHAGDGNLHATPVMNPKWTLEQWRDTLERILVDIYELAASLGGTISGEHGIGHKRKKHLPLVCSNAHLEMMRSIKRALDPNNVLNPGKIVDARERP